MTSGGSGARNIFRARACLFFLKHQACTRVAEWLLSRRRSRRNDLVARHGGERDTSRCRARRRARAQIGACRMAGLGRSDPDEGTIDRRVGVGHVDHHVAVEGQHGLQPGLVSRGRRCRGSALGVSCREAALLPLDQVVARGLGKKRRVGARRVLQGTGRGDPQTGHLLRQPEPLRDHGAHGLVRRTQAAPRDFARKGGKIRCPGAGCLCSGVFPPWGDLAVDRCRASVRRPFDGIRFRACRNGFDRPRLTSNWLITTLRS